MPSKAKSTSKPRPPFHLKLRAFCPAEGSKDRNENGDENNHEHSKKIHWRTHLRVQNPMKYQAYLKYEALVKRKNRAEKREYLDQPGNEVEKKGNLAHRAKQQREYRSKRKLKEEEAKKKAEKGKQPVKMTRAQSDKEAKRKEINAAKKREYRNRLSNEKRQEILDRRRRKRREEKELLIGQEQLIQQHKKEIIEARAEKKRHQEEEKRLREAQEQMEKEKRRLNIRSGDARRQSLIRARSALSTDPEIYTDTVEDLVHKASPRKKHLLQEKGIRTDVTAQAIHESVAEKIRNMRKSRKKTDLMVKRHMIPSKRICRKYKCQTVLCKNLGITSKCLRPKSTCKPHSRPSQIPAETRDTVQRFYQDNATTLPDKKFVSKRTKKACAFLTMTVRGLFAKFQKENPAMKVGLSTFAALKPTHVKHRHLITYRGCLCEYCQNVELKMAAINKLANHSIFKDIYDFNAATLCERADNQPFHKLPCIQRQCGNCGTSKLDAVLDLDVLKHKGNVEWKKWARETKEENGKKTSRMVLGRKEGPLEEMLQELKIEAAALSEHLFTASWQSREFLRVSKSPPSRSVVMVLDFAENYSCRFQDEVQAVHWGHDSATIHPIVGYYKCPDCTETVTESMIMITKDNVHDFNAVQ